MTQHFIVIGNPISHSQSPQIHQTFATQANIDISYQRQYCPDNEASFVAVVEAFFNGGGVGANVTVPFKQLAFAHCQLQGGLSEHARVAGAVNTLLIKDGAVYGDNTDGQGLVNHITSLDWSLMVTERRTRGCHRRRRCRSRSHIAANSSRYFQINGGQSHFE